MLYNSLKHSITREKSLQMMYRCSILTAVVSAIAIAVGFLAILRTDSLPYSIGGGVIAGGMALIMTICPLCMSREGKKTTTGTKMTRIFKFNLICMIVWFCFTLCCIVAALLVPGLFGMLICILEKQRERQIFRGLCSDQTNTKLIFSVLTFVLSFILGILTTVINCIVCCNSKAFGSKTTKDRCNEFYGGLMRREMQQEEIDRCTLVRGDHTRRLNEYDDISTNRQQQRTRQRQDYDAGNVGEYPREPTAPELEYFPMYRDDRYKQDESQHGIFRDNPRGRYEDTNPLQYAHNSNYSRINYDDRRHPSRFDDDRNQTHISDENRYRPTAPYAFQVNWNERGQTFQNGNEEPPPSYADVVDKR